MLLHVGNRTFQHITDLQNINKDWSSQRDNLPHIGNRKKTYITERQHLSKTAGSKRDIFLHVGNLIKAERTWILPNLHFKTRGAE